MKSSGHQTRRVMKRADYSHREPKIWMDKEKFKSLAKTGKREDGNGKSYNANMRDIAYILFGEEFGKFYEIGKYDLTIQEAADTCPEMLLERIIKITNLTKMPYGKVVTIMGLRKNSYFVENAPAGEKVILAGEKNTDLH